jgi:hypothetical protein
MTPQEMASVLNVTRDLVEAQNSEIKRLRDKEATMTEMMSKYVNAVEYHNTRCEDECDKGKNCGWSGYLKRSGRHCGQCPVVFKVDVMPTKGSA